jgi:hypothetical protein
MYSFYLKLGKIDIFIKTTGRQGNMKETVHMVSLYVTRDIPEKNGTVPFKTVRMVTLYVTRDIPEFAVGAVTYSAVTYSAIILELTGNRLAAQAEESDVLFVWPYRARTLAAELSSLWSDQKTEFSQISGNAACFYTHIRVITVESLYSRIIFRKWTKLGKLDI